MDKEKVIEIIVQAVKEISSVRFYKTERGFQGRFAWVRSFGARLDF
jgi:hypothetical protein